jgi:hypothetical protein
VARNDVTDTNGWFSKPDQETNVQDKEKLETVQASLIAM